MGIALVPEGRRVFPSLSVRENLQIGAYGGRKGDWNIESVLELFPLLKPLIKRQASSLSGGEQQALAIGRALMSNPRAAAARRGLAGPRAGGHQAHLRGDGATWSAPAPPSSWSSRTCSTCSPSPTTSPVSSRADRLEGKPSDLTSEAITAAYFGM